MFNIGSRSVSAGQPQLQFNLVISPAEFLSLTALSIRSIPSRVKRFGNGAIVAVLHTCTQS